MKRLYIDIRDKAQNNKIVRTYIYKVDTSIIVTSLQRLMIIEHERNSKTTYIDLSDTEVFSVRNWGN